MLLPWIVPEVVTALTWRSIYDPIFGGLNPILMQLGHYRPSGGMAGRTGIGDAKRDRGQCLERHTFLYHSAAGRS